MPTDIRDVRRRIPRAVRLKRVKAQLAVLWSIAVRRRDGACVLCGKMDTLQAHHWLFHKAHSMALAFNPANGATLCYGCHIIKIHMRADGSEILRLYETMREKLGQETIDAMREIAKPPHEEWTLEMFEELREYAWEVVEKMHERKL